jgi:hypothetical protein
LGGRLTNVLGNRPVAFGEGGLFLFVLVNRCNDGYDERQQRDKQMLKLIISVKASLTSTGITSLQEG